jgi:hypothetical protein
MSSNDSTLSNREIYKNNMIIDNKMQKVTNILITVIKTIIIY